MCGRYTLTQPMKSIASHFGPLKVEGTHSERYNIAPSQQAAVVGLSEGERWLKPMTWGFVPPWARDHRGGFINARAENARAETAAEKPSFRDAFRSRRCLVPADGFLEWEKSGQKKIPHYFRLRSEGLFAFAGLFAEKLENGNRLLTFTILTTRANALVAPWHDRMPVILAPEAYARWLAPDGRPRCVAHSVFGAGHGAVHRFQRGQLPGQRPTLVPCARAALIPLTSSPSARTIPCPDAAVPSAASSPAHRSRNGRKSDRGYPAGRC